MDPRTVQYYDDHAEHCCELYRRSRSGVAKYFKLAFPPGSEVLDIGSGSGRDMDLLAAEECEPYGAEPSARMRERAARHTPHLAGRICGGSLPGLSQQLGRRYDGVLCAAILQHIPEEQIFDAAFDIRNLLKPGGRLLLSFPKDRPGIDAMGRDEHGRLYTKLNPGSVELLFERLGFLRIGKWEDEDSLGRAGYSWITLLFALQSGEPLRPIDQIEGVLNRDRKVATYKLALFRALCEIALTNYHLAEWLSDDEVGIPVQDIAERWIYYYWPLLEDESTFIPQIRGESRSGRLRIGFRSELENLIRSFRLAGGLDGFAVALSGDVFDEGQRRALRSLFTKLIPVIVSGPVTYAGGSLRTGRLFSYDASRRQVVVGTEIWRELCLAGHWVQDALILRWGELTSEISRRSISPSEVIDRLLRIPMRERNVQDAKKVYLALPSKECVWSGRSLCRRFDVDHVVPFSLWHNNDLWNLLPASPQINREKGDSLPTNSLLRRRRDAILGYWDALRGANPRRFEHEIARFAGTRAPDPSWCFSALLESVEATALQRGCMRWEP